MYIEYCNVLVGLICSVIVSSLLFFLAFYLLSPKKKDVMQNSAYECGFQPFKESTNRFDVRYYLVAILFILFDLEVMFLVPWAVVFTKLPGEGYMAMLIFLLTLTVGYAYE